MANSSDNLKRLKRYYGDETTTILIEDEKVTLILEGEGQPAQVNELDFGSAEEMLLWLITKEKNFTVTDLSTNKLFFEQLKEELEYRGMWGEPAHFTEIPSEQEEHKVIETEGPKVKFSILDRYTHKSEIVELDDGEAKEMFSWMIARGMNFEGREM